MDLYDGLRARGEERVAAHPPPAPRPANEARVRGKDDLSDTVDFEFRTQFLYLHNKDRSVDLYDARPANDARVRGKDDLSDTVDFELRTQFRTYTIKTGVWISTMDCVREARSGSLRILHPRPAPLTKPACVARMTSQTP